MWVSLIAAGRYIFSLDAVAMDVRTVVPLGYRRAAKPRPAAEVRSPLPRGRKWQRLGFFGDGPMVSLAPANCGHSTNGETEYFGNGCFVEYGKNARHSYLSKSFRAPNFRRNNVAVNRVAIAAKPQIVTAKKVDADIFS